ncbi:MAG TPA: hypothetical protein VG795_14275 [Acidimicrobiia bacterium]|nr:hypothetical protein [Acidimicrobiia bacterium]
MSRCKMRAVIAAAGAALAVGTMPGAAQARTESEVCYINQIHDVGECVCILIEGIIAPGPDPECPTNG